MEEQLSEGRVKNDKQKACRQRLLLGGTQGFAEDVAHVSCKSVAGKGLGMASTLCGAGGGRKSYVNNLSKSKLRTLLFTEAAQHNQHHCAWGPLRRPPLIVAKGPANKAAQSKEIQNACWSGMILQVGPKLK